MKKDLQQSPVVLRRYKKLVLAGLLLAGLAACDRGPRPPGPPSQPPKPQTGTESFVPGVHTALFIYSGPPSLPGRGEPKEGRKRRLIQS